MSGKLINKKLKGTKQQPPDEPREPLVRELFPNTTPKSDKKKNKKKTGVGKSSESVKGLGRGPERRQCQPRLGNRVGGFGVSLRGPG